MKDKENQIEEMAKFMHYKAHGKDKYCDNEKCEMCWCSCKDDAEALYNAGYRKIDKDSVVLSREKYEMLANQYKNLEIKYSNLCDNYRLCKDANETLKQNIIITRNETAEKILKDFKLWAREYQNKDIIIDDNGERLMTNNEKLNYLYTYLCDKYKVEIKESNMGSEKVKEIKEKLQGEIFVAYSFGDKSRKVPTKEVEKILTLINELESENEELKQHKRELQSAQQDLIKQIAELEKGKTEQLKQFAESICRELWDVRVDGNGERFKCGDLTSKDVWRIAKQYLVEEGKAQ